MLIESILSHLDSLSISFEFRGDLEHSVYSAQSLENAGSDQFCYLNQKKLVKAVAESKSGLIVTHPRFIEGLELANNLLLVDNPHYVFAVLMQLFYPQDGAMDAVDAVISSCAKIGHNTLVSPGVIIQENVQIGDNCRLGANVVIQKNCLIGNDVTIEAGSVIGGDGFGWAFEQGRWHKIPQIGRVVIQDRVSIGNNCCIDRGAIDDTVIEEDVIIDNLVHIAHNVVIKKGSAVAAQVGFAGSTTIGEHNMIAGQAGFAGHIETADQCQFHAKSGVTHSIKTSGVYAGFPAYEARQWQRNTVKLQKLEALSKQVKTLSAAVDLLTKQNQ